MPIYEYRCPKCKHKFDKITTFADFDKPVICEKCKKAKAERQISTGIRGTTTAQPWEYEETHKCNNGRGPNYVRDSSGQRQKFNPTVHRKGRKGSG